jgi:FMN phosphatase YigB (HAD superfamily)
MSTFNWDDIDTVLLDMDGTLLNLHFDNYFWKTYIVEQYAKKNHIPIKHAQSKINYLSNQTQGKLNWYCLDFWSDQLALPIAQLKENIIPKIQPRPYTYEFLRMLTDLNKTILIVTNAHRDSFNLKMSHSNILMFIDHAISAHDYFYPKERIEFWQQLQLHHPFDKNRTLFLDDSTSVLNCAQKYGIRHIVEILHPDTTMTPNTLGLHRGIHDFNELE